MKRYLKFILAGVLALSLIAAGLSCTGSTPTATSSPLAQLEKRVDDLQAAYVNLSTSTSWATKAQIDTVNAQIATINSSIVTLQGQITSPNVRLSQVEADIVALQKLIGDVSAINTKLAALETKVNAITPVDISGLQTAVTGLQSAMTALQAKVTAQDAEIAALKSRVVVLETPLTTTTTPPTTTPIMAAEAIEVTVTSLPAIMSYPVADTVTSYYLTIKYTNTKNKAFTNVKFKLTLYGTVVSFTSAAFTPVVPTTPMWAFAGGTGNIVNYQTVTGINVAANATGELIVKLDVKCAGTGELFSIVAVQ